MAQKTSRLRAMEYKCPRKVWSTVFRTQDWIKGNKIDAPEVPFELPGATAQPFFELFPASGIRNILFC